MAYADPHKLYYVFNKETNNWEEVRANTNRYIGSCQRTKSYTLSELEIETDPGRIAILNADLVRVQEQLDEAQAEIG